MFSKSRYAMPGKTFISECHISKYHFQLSRDDQALFGSVVNQLTTFKWGHLLGNTCTCVRYAMVVIKSQRNDRIWKKRLATPVLETRGGDTVVPGSFSQSLVVRVCIHSMDEKLSILISWLHQLILIYTDFKRTLKMM